MDFPSSLPVLPGRVDRDRAASRRVLQKRGFTRRGRDAAGQEASALGAPAGAR